MIRIHGRLIAKTGGMDGVRDAGLVESAVLRARAGFGDVERYPTAIDQAAAVCEGLVANHGFVDGNKRIGVVVMLLILAKNGVHLRYAQPELVDLGLGTARGDLRQRDIADWIQKHIV